MDILLTAISLACVLGNFLAVTRTDKTEERCKQHADAAEEAKVAMLEDRHRLTSVERDLDATRRELRKVAGKFYQLARELEGDLDDMGLGSDHDAARYFARNPPASPVLLNGELVAACENWQAAQIEGPKSKAAQCECRYCLEQREKRRAEKAAILASRPALKPVNGGE